MYIYYAIIITWLISYILLKPHPSKPASRFRYAVVAGLFLFLLMGLRKYTVGNDIYRYIQGLQSAIPEFSERIFIYDEWGYQAFLVILKKIGIASQGYIIITSAIIVASFTIFYLKYSRNIFMSFFLHLTIGLFTMSMSGIRQTLAICLILLAFHFAVKKKLLGFLVVIIVAQTFHNSAIVFLPVYLVKNIDITRKKGILLLVITSSFLFIRTTLTPLLEIFVPDRYITRYELLSDAFKVNPLLIIIAFAIPAACLVFWKKIEFINPNEKRIFSILFILACMNLFFNILSLNSNMLGRLSFYFLPFITVLIPNVISIIKDKKMRLIALYLAFVLPIIQFAISTPGGVYRIDRYLFFWQ